MCFPVIPSYRGMRIKLVSRRISSYIRHAERFVVIPYDRTFWKVDQGSVAPPDGSQHVVLHATVTRLEEHSLTLSRAIPEAGFAEPKLSFDYLVYALGSHPPEPIDLWSPLNVGSIPYDGTKPKGVQWMKAAQKRIEEAPSILVVGGGALGIRT